MTRSISSSRYFELTCAQKHRALPHRVGSLAGVTYLRYTVLTSPNKGETAVHCRDPPLSLLVMLVSRSTISDRNDLLNRISVVHRGVGHGLGVSEMYQPAKCHIYQHVGWLKPCPNRKYLAIKHDQLLTKHFPCIPPLSVSTSV